MADSHVKGELCLPQLKGQTEFHISSRNHMMVARQYEITLPAHFVAIYTYENESVSQLPENV